MKRITIIFSALTFLLFFGGLKGFAQSSDDIYYSGGNSKSDPAVSGSTEGSQNYTSQSTGDGYSSDYKLQSSKSYVDSNGNTVTNNYYSDNDYTSQLDRYYVGCG